MQLMRRFARMGETVYVNSIVMQKPTLKRNTAGGKSFSQKFVRKMRSILRGLQDSGAGFWVYSPFTLPVHHLAWARSLNEMILRCQIRHVSHKLNLAKPTVWVACPAACDTALKIREGLLVYQRTDRFEEYPNVDSNIIKAYDLKLKAQADLTLFVNRLLFDEESDQCRKAFYLDHGVDYKSFSTAEQDPDRPEDVADIPKPIVGFFGAIDDHTFDAGLVETIADLLPEMSIVLVGNVSSQTNGLADKPNVWFLGQKDYEQIPHYGKCFDVAIMPWSQNRWIEACNPVKLKEYLALGKPVVSTPFAELREYLDVVRVARTPDEFAAHVKEAIKDDSAELVAERKKKVEKASWDDKAHLLVTELLGSKDIG